tara:strand:+ start:4680 stop:4979 length:300 start_codon:yes stop_codon:yes gene_type:complete
MADKEVVVEGMSREELCSLNVGEVIAYDSGGTVSYLVVSGVDGVGMRVCGRVVEEFLGVNSIPVDELEGKARRITRRTEGVDGPLGDALYGGSFDKESI